MTMTTTVNTSNAEFTLAERLKTNRQTPVRWIISHALHHWPLGISMSVGAFGNAALAAMVPVFIGQALTRSWLLPLKHLNSSALPC